MVPDSQLREARVIRINDDFTADVQYLDDGWTVGRCSIMCAFASSKAANIEPPDLDPSAQPGNDPGGDSRYAVAIMGILRGAPVVLGFTRTAYSELLFADQRALHRYNSDVYRSVDADGNFEFFHPSGAFVRIGETPTHEDLTARDIAQRFKLTRNTDKQLYISIVNANAAGQVSSFTMDPVGNVVVKGAATLTMQARALDLQADTAILLDAPQIVTTGEFLSVGRISSDVDVAVGPVSLASHSHAGVASGDSVTAIPTGGGPLAGSYGNEGNPAAPLGLQHNNPGNLRTNGGAPFQGQTGFDSSGFLFFSSPYFGTRALALDLLHQQSLNGLDTVTGIITKFAPPSDGNPTAAYIANVATAVGVDPNQPLNMADPAVLLPFTKAVILQENGEQPFSDSEVGAAVQAAIATG